MNIEQKLNEMNIMIPDAPNPAANYSPYIITGKLLFISGQLPSKSGTLIATGIVGNDVTQETAISCAKQCAINILAQVKVACDNDWSKVAQCVKLGVFVASEKTFTNQSLIANGASNLIVELFAEKGKHARFAVGVASLPLNAPVEIDAIFELV